MNSHITGFFSGDPEGIQTPNLRLLRGAKIEIFQSGEARLDKSFTSSSPVPIR